MPLNRAARAAASSAEVKRCAADAYSLFGELAAPFMDRLAFAMADAGRYSSSKAFSSIAGEVRRIAPKTNPDPDFTAYRRLQAAKLEELFTLLTKAP